MEVQDVIRQAPEALTVKRHHWVMVTAAFPRLPDAALASRGVPFPYGP